MSKKKSCSDSGPPPSGDSIQINILDEKGIEIVHTKSYGVGIDCHRDFIQVSVIVKGDENKTIDGNNNFLFKIATLSGHPFVSITSS